MTEEQDEVKIASPLPVILSGLINGGLFCLVWYLAFTKNTAAHPNQMAAINIAFLVSTVVVAQIFFRRTIGTEITFLKIMVSGWMASIMFGLIVAIFYRQFFPTIGSPAPPFFYVVMSTSSFGLVISAIVAFFITRKY